MQQAFAQHIHQRFPELFKKDFLVAISGGLDSVVLTHLLHELKVNFQLAHCNFNLRGDESDGDEQFVYDLAKKLDLRIHSKHFQTKKAAADKGVSTQMAARGLRYDWFKEVLEEQELPAVITAHHLDDQIETFLINLNRGTGLAGLTGIPEENDLLLRPLLSFSREQILQYAQVNNLKWREDSSNASNDYQRNQLRNQVLPLLHDALPQLKSNFVSTLTYLNDVRSIVDDAVVRFRESVTTPNTTAFDIHIDEVKAFNNFEKHLFYLLQPYGFTKTVEVLQLMDAETGKQLINQEFRLLKDRGFLRLEKSQKLVTTRWYLLPETTAAEVHEAKLEIVTIRPDDPIEFVKKHIDKNVLLLDSSRLEYPLTLRVWEAGDRLEPYGMVGSQLVSDVLINNKVSLLEKERCFVLESGHHILWVMGLRASRFHTVTAQTKEIKKITWGT